MISGSWDKTLRFWDARSHSASASVRLPGKVYGMDCGGSVLVVAMSDRLVSIYDTRHVAEPVQSRESALNHQTRCIRLFGNGTGYYTGSIEGRVAVDYLATDGASQAQKYAFKAHCRPSDADPNTMLLYPVHAIASHPRYARRAASRLTRSSHPTLATGGGDGLVCFWDRQNRRKIRALPQLPTGISALEFSPDGRRLAIASSYGYDVGEKE